MRTGSNEIVWETLQHVSVQSDSTWTVYCKIASSCKRMDKSIRMDKTMNESG